MHCALYLYIVTDDCLNKKLQNMPPGKSAGFDYGLKNHNCTFVYNL